MKSPSQKLAYVATNKKYLDMSVSDIAEDWEKNYQNAQPKQIKNKSAILAMARAVDFSVELGDLIEPVIQEQNKARKAMIARLAQAGWMVLNQ